MSSVLVIQSSTFSKNLCKLPVFFIKSIFYVNYNFFFRFYMKLLDIMKFLKSNH